MRGERGRERGERGRERRERKRGDTSTSYKGEGEKDGIRKRWELKTQEAVSYIIIFLTGIALILQSTLSRISGFHEWSH